MEAATPGSERGTVAGIRYDNEAASSAYTQRWTTFATRVMDCVSRAFRKVGTSPLMEDVIFWDLSLAKRIGMNEIVDRPMTFIQALRSEFGDAGTAVFEYKLVREIKKEFQLVGPSDRELANKRELGIVLQAVLNTAWTTSS